MFCTKCGAENREDAKFCSKCGAKLKKNDKLGTDSSSTQPQSSAPWLKYEQQYGNSDKDRDKKRRNIIIGVIAAIVLIIIIAAAASGTDYVQTVKNLTPMEDYGNYNTLGTVFDKYMTNQKWTTEKSGDDILVRFDGKLLNRDITLLYVLNDLGNGFTDYNLAVVTIDGQGTSKEEFALLMTALWAAYDNGVSRDNLYNYLFG